MSEINKFKINQEGLTTPKVNHFQLFS